MEHILSKINVTIDGSNLCKVKLLSTPVTAKYNLKTKEITTGSISNLNANTSTLLILPSSQQLRMNITYNGKEYEYVESQKKYEPGKEYTFNLTISDNKNLIINGNIQITDWKDAGNFEGSVNEI